MSDYYLKAASEAALWAALEAAGLVMMTDAGRVPEGVDLDVIGTIYVETGTLQIVDGIQVAVTVPVPGYHANLRGSLTADQALQLPIIAPRTNPVRRWA